MRKNDQHTESKVDESLRSLDHIEQAKAPDFFYTRLQARMEAEMLGKPSGFFRLGNLRLSVALLVIVFVMNFLSLVLIDFSGNTSPDGLSTLSSEYFSPTDDYDYLSVQE
ncbi:hypothetical protein [Roseivirga sp.]|uniref:hypothetical protein n=1 Tax=Roseivirga sp. TaxID=1964215 RepID=UPI003B5156A6